MLVCQDEEHQIVEGFPYERQAAYLRFDPAAILALVDAMICSALAPMIAWAENGPITQLWPVKFAQDVRSLPEWDHGSHR